MSNLSRALLLLAAIACVGCSEPARGVILITIDTTRADRLGCYGYDEAETPNLDALAAEATLFTQAQSPVPTTLASHATIFTGTYPTVHGVRYNGMFRLPESSLTLAEILRDAGWETAGVPASFPLTVTAGIGQGFDSYQDMFSNPEGENPGPNAERDAAETTRLGLEWLEKQGGDGFFVWLHYWSPHAPYEPPFPYSTRFRDRPYDGEIAYADRQIGELLDGLREMGLWDEALIVFAGDHGEGLYDHGEALHGYLAYQSTLQVPLIVKAPGGARARRVNDAVSLADVAPTILDYAGVAVPPGLDGVSLRRAVDGKELPERPIYFEAITGSLTYGWDPLEGIRRGRWKYVRSGSPELYDLDEDPAEEVNLRDVEPRIAREMDLELAALLDRWAESAREAETAAVPLEADEIERLAALGYVGGTISEERRGGPQPRDLIHLEIGLLFAQELMLSSKRYDTALEAWKEILREDPTNRFALVQGSYAATHVGELALAFEYATEANRIYPEFIPAVVQLGQLWVVRGEPATAVEVFRAGLDRHPDEPALTYRLSLALLASGRPEEAAEEVARAIDAGTDDPSFLVVRALCEATLGDSEGALTALEEAIRGGYTDRKVLEQEPMLEPLRHLTGFQEALDSIPPDA